MATSEQDAALSAEFEFDDSDDADDLLDDDFFGYQPKRFLRQQRKLQSSTSESTQVNVWGRLKESLGMTIIGFILIVVMPCLIWKNEGRHVRELKRIDFCRNKAVQVDCINVGDDTVERLVYFTGQVQAGGQAGKAILDFGGGNLNLSSGLPQALAMRRTCYIYQKFEEAVNSTDRNRVGGGETRTTTYNLKEDWTAMGPQKAQLEHLTEETNTRGIWEELVTATKGESTTDSSTPSANAMPNEIASALGLHDKNAKPHAIIVSTKARVGEYGLSSRKTRPSFSVRIWYLFPVNSFSFRSPIVPVWYGGLTIS